MARVHTHYDNLKVARNAPPEVIRAAYKALSQKHHPDRHGNSPEAIRIIQLINTAYEVLSDPARRREHDEWIADAEGEQLESSAQTRSTRTTRTSRKSARHTAQPAHPGRSRSTPMARIAQHAAQLWDRLRRKLNRKSFRKA